MVGLFVLPPASAAAAPRVVTRAHGQVRAGDFLAGAVEFGVVGNFVAFARYGIGEYDFGKCVEVLVAADCEAHGPRVGVDVPDCAAFFAAFDVEDGLDFGDVVAVLEVRFNEFPRLCIQSVECGQEAEFGSVPVAETDPLVGRGKGKTKDHPIYGLFLTVGEEEQAIAVLTYVNGLGNELVLCDEVHVMPLQARIACRTGGRRGRHWRVAGCVCPIRRFCRGR